ncbi:MAG: hypothetical protein KDD82_13720 [Planctomycetes bacterium]|nr:hypothetical protein [Planctomycetota bacterium]
MPPPAVSLPRLALPYAEAETDTEAEADTDTEAAAAADTEGTGEGKLRPYGWVNADVLSARIPRT